MRIGTISPVVIGLLATILVAGHAPGSPASSPSAGPQSDDYASLRSTAEQHYAERSYARVVAIYERALALDLDDEQRNWVAFRLADSAWRAAARRQDNNAIERARSELGSMVTPEARAQTGDTLWVEALESLADSHWTAGDWYSAGDAWPHYKRALAWWANSSDIEVARRRYLEIVWKLGRPLVEKGYYRYPDEEDRRGLDPAEVFDDALRVAVTVEDRARAHFLLADALVRRNWANDSPTRISRALETGLAATPGTTWRDDMLFLAAQWMEQHGNPDRYENERWLYIPDYSRALELLRSLVAETREGESAYLDDATEAIAKLTRVSVGVNVSGIFLPGSEIVFDLRWRNTDRIDLQLHRVDLPRDLDLSALTGRGDNWLLHIELAQGPALRSWSVTTGDDGQHRPAVRQIRLDRPLSAGAYVVEATATSADGPRRARELILVTDTTLLIKRTDREVLVYLADAASGAPVSDAPVTLWSNHYVNRAWSWVNRRATTGVDGTAVLPLDPNTQWARVIVAAGPDDRPALAWDRIRNWRDPSDNWKIYAFTDRPAYRPGETARWKIVARRYDDGTYATPAEETLWYEIYAPSGTKVTEGPLALNGFGSAWGELQLDPRMSLGDYYIATLSRQNGERLSYNALFRLEEYRLPEFKVTVATSTAADGRPSAYRFGDTIEATVHAEYYSGGNVADSTVRVTIHQSLFRHRWHPKREFDWYDQDAESGARNDHQVVERQTLTTDSDGRATIRFKTPVTNAHDLEYRIVAWVSDASRREIVAESTVRVTSQRAFVYANPRHLIYRPLDTVEVDLAAVDANDSDERVLGTMVVHRKTSAARGDDPEQVDRERILSEQVEINGTNGASFTFVAARTGQYEIEFGGHDADGNAVKATTTVWVADNDSSDLGYRHGDVAIVLDKDTYEVGDVATVMLTAASPGRSVLLSIEGDGLVSYEVVHLSGTAKLVEIELGPRHAPNVRLSGVMIADYRIYGDAQELIVVPTNEFLQVQVHSDRDQYQPGEIGELTVAVRDAEGQPVVAELALAVFDDAVSYIQSEIAQDPRRHFYGNKRQSGVTSATSFQRGRFLDLAETDAGALFDRLDPERAAISEPLPSDRINKPQAGAWTYDGAEPIYMQSLPASPSYYDSALGILQRGVMVSGSSPVIQRYLPPASEMSAPAVRSPRIRTDFRATALWIPDVTTGTDGTARVEFTYPDSVTSWHATARVATRGNAFGVGQVITRTHKPLIARLQTPRFLVTGDRATISAVINNNTDEPISLAPELLAEGVELLGGGTGNSAPAAALAIPAQGTGRADWSVLASAPGPLALTVLADAGAHRDAVERHLMAHDHGIDKLAYAAGTLRSAEAVVNVQLPADRQPGSTRALVQVTPSLAVSLLDALPYLIDYPYGCTEQTMSRFVPAVITAATMRDLGLSATDVLDRVFGEAAAAPTTRLPQQPTNLEQLDRVVQLGLQRLYDFQRHDGGWGWWAESPADHYMSAYVLWGLILARNAGVVVDRNVVEEAVRFLHRQLVEDATDLDTQAWMLHALATYEIGRQRELRNAAPGRPSPRSARAAEIQAEFERARSAAFENLWQERDRLSAYSLALLTLSAHHLGHEERALVLVRNLEDGAIFDGPAKLPTHAANAALNPNAEGTAHWGVVNGWRRWADGPVESTSFALRALLAVDPDNPLVAPATNWLIKNRRGARWNNTRDTAIAVLALNEYLSASGELLADIEYEVLVNGTTVARHRVAGDEILRAPRSIPIDPSLVVDGRNEIRVVRHDGDGPLYFAAQVTYLSREEPVTAAGAGIFVERQYNRLMGRQTLLNGHVYDRQALQDGDTVVSGERIEVVLTIETTGDFEYLLIEDLKPAGFEAVERKSGQFKIVQLVDGALLADRDYDSRSEQRGRTVWGHRELRDRKVAFFIDKLGQGWWEIRYFLRAEVPGEFHALPTLAEAMYLPEIRANGREIRLRITDKQ